MESDSTTSGFPSLPALPLLPYATFLSPTSSNVLLPSSSHSSKGDRLTTAVISRPGREASSFSKRASSSSASQSSCSHWWPPPSPSERISGGPGGGVDSSQVGRLRQPPASKRKSTNIRTVLDQVCLGKGVLSSTTPFSLRFTPPSTAPSGPVEALAATCGSTARLKWGVCGVVCGHRCCCSKPVQPAQLSPPPAPTPLSLSSIFLMRIVSRRVSHTMMEEGRPSRCSHLRNEPICHSPNACQETRSDAWPAQPRPGHRRGTRLIKHLPPCHLHFALPKNPKRRSKQAKKPWGYALHAGL